MQKGERDSIVRAEGLTKIFAVKGEKDVAALDDLDFCLQEGQAYGVGWAGWRGKNNFDAAALRPDDEDFGHADRSGPGCHAGAGTRTEGAQLYAAEVWTV